jgi:hypothetical protein
MSEVFRVVKTYPGQPIRAYKKSAGEIGAEMERDKFIEALAEEFGNPLMVLTRAQMLERLKIAADKVQEKMQQATASVAGAKV